MATMPTLVDALVIFAVVHGMIFAILTCLSRFFFRFTSNTNYELHCMSFNNIPKKNVHELISFSTVFSLFFFVVEK